MDTDQVTLQLPAKLYEKLQTLATVAHTDPIGIITQLVTDAYQHREWLQALTDLRQQIQEEGGLQQQLGNTKEEMIDRLRQTREEVFEIDYANLYR